MEDSENKDKGSLWFKLAVFKLYRLVPDLFKPSRILFFIRRLFGDDQLVLVAIAALLGLIVSGGVVVFREFVNLIEIFAYGYEEGVTLSGMIEAMPWWKIIMVPTIGGFVVGVFYFYFMPGGRPLAISHVIASSAFNRGQISLKEGIAAAFGSALSIGVGGCVGREGPAVHLGASVASWISRKFRFSRSLARTMLGCGSAAAVAASFNAPIAGALFAQEVVVGNYALNSFAPVVIASVVATIISRAWYGSFPSFVLPEFDLVSVWEFPAVIVLGVLCGCFALFFIQGIFKAEKIFQRLRFHPVYRTTTAGFILGVIALVFPQIIGVGYENTDAALKGVCPFWALIGLVIARLIATSVCLGNGFGGGVFSPSIALGAVLGGAYGMIVTFFFPDYCSGTSTYALVGMGALAAAVMGAPISTVIIIFELTGNYNLTIAVMVGVVIASITAQQFLGSKSFFMYDLERQGIDVTGSHEVRLLRTIRVRDIMKNNYDSVAFDTDIVEVREKIKSTNNGGVFVIDEKGSLFGTLTLADMRDAAFDHDFDGVLTAAEIARQHPPFLLADDTLETAVKKMLEEMEEHIAVVDNANDMQVVGCAHESDVLLSYSRSLVKLRAEERGQKIISAPF